MTQQQRQQVSVATIVTIATLVSGVAGAILGAYKFGDDRYVRKDEMVALRKDVEYMKAAVDRIERRQLGTESSQTSSPLASRNSHGNAPTP